MPPVSFKVFSQLVENLPDIAFQIQVAEITKNKLTLDECAQWFYTEFYANPSIRTKYEVNIKSCPQAIKNKLLQLPTVETAVSSDADKDADPQERGVEIRVKNSGRYLFPVAFATFKQYINKERLNDYLMRKMTMEERQSLLADSKKSGELLRKGYNTFYMFPRRRRMDKYEFKDVPPQLLQQLLKPGVPLDEIPVISMKSTPPSGEVSELYELSSLLPRVRFNLLCSITSIVTFDVFEKFVSNIYDIVWRLKLNDLDYKYKGFEQCAKEYYLAFYLTPEVRESFPIELGPCTTTMRNRLLALPNEKDTMTLKELQKLTRKIASTQELELQVISPPLSKENYKEPIGVTFKLFKRYIKNLDKIVNEMQRCEEYKGKTNVECALEYYKAFYTSSQIREKFIYELKPCPAKMREKLLALPPAKELKVANEKNNDIDFLRDGIMIKIKGVNYAYPVTNSEKNMGNYEKPEDISKSLPVSFRLFKKYVKNLDAIVQQMLDSDEHTGKSEDECAFEYFTAFYFDPAIREKFQFEIKPCPAKLREKLLSIHAIEHESEPERELEAEAVSMLETDLEPRTELDVSEAQLFENVSPRTVDSNSEHSNISQVVVISQRILITLKNMIYEFPVTLQTFKLFINYETLKPQLEKASKKSVPDSTLNDERSNLALLRRFYHSFYIDGSVRKLFKFNFNAAPVEFRQKLLEYAVPIVEATPSALDSDVIDTLDSVSQCAMELDDISPAEEDSDSVLCDGFYPVSYEIFSKMLCLDDVVNQMQKEAQYSQLCEEACKLIYFDAFYRTPEIRMKYGCAIRPCDAGLRNKILEIPQIKPHSDHTYGRDSFSISESESLDDLYRTRSSELEQLKKENVIEYIPHNLTYYIAYRTLNLRTRALLEKHFIIDRRARQQAVIANIAKPETITKNLSAGDKSTSMDIDEKASNTVISAVNTKKKIANQGTFATALRETLGALKLANRAPRVPTRVTRKVSRFTTITSPMSTDDDSEDSEKDVSNGTSTTIKSDTKSAVTATIVETETETGASNEPSTNIEPETTSAASEAHKSSSTLAIKAPESEHNLKFLINRSDGLKQTIWCILAQLTYREFQKYTCIHNAEFIYEDERLISRVYCHVIRKGNWPISLYVKMPLLKELLLSKDVQIDSLDLAYFSPKILHSHELMRYTNFDDIAESHYRKSTGNNCDELVDLFSEVDNFYEKCWKHDKWIHQVPRITAQELLLSSASNEPITLNIPESMATQLEQSTCELSFVDVDSVGAASQLSQSSIDPLMETTIAMLCDKVKIKQEPVRFLTNMRFIIDSERSQEVQCETIPLEEQIINLDEEDERIAAELSCFAMVPPKERSPPLSLLCENTSQSDGLQEVMLDVNLSTDLQLQITNQLNSLESSQPTVILEPPAEDASQVTVAPSAAVVATASAQFVRTRKQGRPPIIIMPNKKPRLMADNVPQLRHGFRPLALTASVPNQATVNSSADPELAATTSQVEQESKESANPMTASQELAADNTLMASSQLQHLLDAPNVTLRQVNLPMPMNCGSDKNDWSIVPVPQSVSLPVLHEHIVFSTLQRFMYFQSLSTLHIAKYQINSLAVGAVHQQALICTNGQLCNVYGPLVENLFPHLTRSLLQDLQCLLGDVSEFVYNCRLNLHQDTKEDVRNRVLYAFMRAAPPFAHIRLQFDNASREYAAFSTISERDGELWRRKPKCDVRAALKPEIVQRMREVKSLCYS
ncbi:hypothetical protein KR093_009174 [Drosophila rubida]|uniref:Protein telomere ends associated n=1 Tax=Drosophila rubida TaxID=30044 RepID=A0AAD4JSS8_9MUSC|nr:hypothetical protein KR093_009174 [Drosophila rubida]